MAVYVPTFFVCNVKLLIYFDLLVLQTTYTINNCSVLQIRTCLDEIACI